MVLSSQLLAILAFLSVTALALPQPDPNPAPEPFFGLLGRLLAASFSGEKENDKGNCACRRTFHQKEKDKDKDKGCDCGDSYGAPVSYNPPSYDPPQSYEPVDSYGAPIAPVYGAPQCDCACDRTFHTKEKKNKDKDKKNPCDCSGYPTYDYAAPSYEYSAPVSYQAPSSGYGAPSSSYGAPSYNPPCSRRRTFHQKEKEKDKKNPCAYYY